LSTEEIESDKESAVSFDNSRFTFDPWKNYSGVVMEQGRVQTDADWNEWLSENSRRVQAGTLDTMGHAVFPATTPYAFLIAADNAGGKNSVRIGDGRMYVDGLLVENRGDRGKAVWDPALDELSNTPQPPPSPLEKLDDSNSIAFDRQPYYPGASVPSGNGEYLAYLDVWRRPVTYIEDASLVDAAIGVDTTGRMQTVWQVGLHLLPGSTVAGAVTSGTFDSDEEVIQTGTGASAYLIGTVAGSGPMSIGPITGSADATDTWVGQTSGAIFTPSAVPVGSCSTIAGSVTSGTFIAHEEVIQENSNASANLIGAVSQSGPMLITKITGTADGTDTWVGQTSGAKFTPTAAPVPSTWSCETPDAAIPWPSTFGILSNDTVSSGPSGPCCLTTGSGYTGVENQFYRVEIHHPGDQGGANATFKWSRENASVQTSVTAIADGKNSLGEPASVLTVQSLGRDQVLGFAAGNWIEITDQRADDKCRPGELYKIDSVDVPSMTITLTTPLSSNFTESSIKSNAWTRIIRWDQSGKILRKDNTVYYDLDAIGSGGLPNGCNGIPVPTDGSWLILESGIVVEFGLTLTTGAYQSLNYWNFAARTADGSIDPLRKAPPRGIYHHFTKLAIVNFETGNATDCRTPWASSDTGGSGGCCTCTVGEDGFGMYSSIQQAIQSLPKKGGAIGILPGNYYENVVLEGLKDVVIFGCGWQTHIYSKSLQPGASAGGSETGASASGLPAVFTIVDCENIELRSFSVTAADKEIGILLDRAPSNDAFRVLDVISDTNVLIQDIALKASTLPAIVARDVSQLKIAENRIAMMDVDSIYAAVYMNGRNIFFERNQVGLAPVETAADRLLETETNAAAMLSTGAFSTRAPGGIQIAGPSKNVFIVENKIEGGSRNGITLGNFIILDKTGVDSGKLTGVQTQLEGICCGGGTGTLPGSTSSGSTIDKIAAGGVICNLHIDRNRISNMGMCGIGPVGFFDLNTTLEIISLVNVGITSNIISRTLLRAMQPFNEKQSKFGYGAISLPDVQNLTVRDNTVTDFGVTPGAEVCGVFVLHGEGIEISRNQIRETRDLGGSSSSVEAMSSFGGMRAGISIYLATPAPLDSSSDSAWNKSLSMLKVATNENSSFNAPRYAPGLPALRIQENQVRVALGLALFARGTGPFSIVDNHFSSGGAVTVSSDGGRNFDFSKPDVAAAGTFAAALTVGILNLGVAIEALSLIQGFTKTFTAAGDIDLDRVGNNLVDSSSGAVLFTNNICQLEAQASGVHGYCSVVIASLDTVLFANNLLWIDAPSHCAFLDGLLFGVTVQATSNRFQEASYYPVIYSGATLGLLNITSQNISTYCMKAVGPAQLFDTPNIVMYPLLCRKRG